MLSDIWRLLYKSKSKRLLTLFSNVFHFKWRFQSEHPPARAGPPPLQISHSCGGCRIQHDRDSDNILSIRYRDTTYEAHSFITLADPNSLSTFVMQFYCKSNCHNLGSWKLGLGVFTLTKPSPESSDLYCVYQDAIDCTYPINII